MTVRVLVGDTREVLKQLPDESVHCIVTSPPYFGLRSYLPEGHPDKAKEIGLEQTPEAYVAELVSVFREARRVLRSDGTVWLNLGSSFCSKRIESEEYVVRRDLPDGQRAEIIQALSSVWAGHASAEQALQRLLENGQRAPGELFGTEVRKVRKVLRAACGTNGAGAREILLPQLCEVGKPDAHQNAGSDELHDLRQGVGAISSRHAQEQDEAGVLQSDVLAPAQSAGTPLSLGGRAARKDESAGDGVAEGGPDPRPLSLPHLFRGSEPGGAPHPAVSEIPRTALGCEQRDNALPVMSSADRQERNGRGGLPSHDRLSSIPDLGRFQFPRSAIPAGFLQFCEPSRVIKPKDDLGIPWAVAFALRDDGWFLRSPIIWHKPNPMPESVTDRPTSAHEHVFLLAKSSRYYFDAEAVKERANVADWDDGSRVFGGANKAGASASHARTTGRQCERPQKIRAIALAKEKGLTEAHIEAIRAAGITDVGKAQTTQTGFGKNTDDVLRLAAEAKEALGGYYREFLFDASARNIRNVWTIATQPYFEAHFATFPPALVEPCIKAGCPVGGTVLDPFGGAGTTALVADRLQRNAILIELNPAYADMARRRLATDRGPLIDALESEAEP